MCLVGCWRHSPKPCPRCRRWTQDQTVTCASLPSSPSTSITDFRMSLIKVPVQPHEPLQTLDTGDLLGNIWCQLTSSTWAGQARPGGYMEMDAVGRMQAWLLFVPSSPPSSQHPLSLTKVYIQCLSKGYIWDTASLGLFKMEYRCAQIVLKLFLNIAEYSK